MGSEMCIRDSTRDAAIDVLTAVTCAAITRTIRGIRSEVEVGPAQGLPETSVIVCDGLVTVPLSMFDRAPVCLLYTSDAADERSSEDLGGRRIIKKKNRQDQCVD